MSHAWQNGETDRQTDRRTNGQTNILGKKIRGGGGGGGGGGALPPIAIRGCAALPSRLWEAIFPKIGCDFMKFP